MSLVSEYREIMEQARAKITEIQDACQHKKRRVWSEPVIPNSLEYNWRGGTVCMDCEMMINCWEGPIGAVPDEARNPNFKRFERIEESAE